MQQIHLYIHATSFPKLCEMFFGALTRYYPSWEEFQHGLDEWDIQRLAPDLYRISMNLYMMWKSKPYLVGVHNHDSEDIFHAYHDDLLSQYRAADTIPLFHHLLTHSEHSFLIEIESDEEEEFYMHIPRDHLMLFSAGMLVYTETYRLRYSESSAPYYSTLFRDAESVQIPYGQWRFGDSPHALHTMLSKFISHHKEELPLLQWSRSKLWHDRFSQPFVSGFIATNTMLASDIIQPPRIPDRCDVHALDEDISFW